MNIHQPINTAAIFLDGVRGHFIKNPAMTVKPKSFVIYHGELLDHHEQSVHHCHKLKPIETAMADILEQIFNEHTFAGKNGLLHSMDAPHCNQPMPTWTRPAAVAVYFGKTKSSVDSKTVWRTAYGTGTGSTLVGRDPRDLCVMDFGPPLESVAVILK